MYEIKILTSDEFDNLPKEITKGSDISDSLGFADPSTGKAYVRYNVFPEIQKYLVEHELDELVAEYSNHEDENGIRHKKKGGFMKIFKPLLTAIGAAVANTFAPGVGSVAIGAGLGRAAGGGISGEKFFKESVPAGLETGSSIYNAGFSGGGPSVAKTMYSELAPGIKGAFSKPKTLEQPSMSSGSFSPMSLFNAESSMSPVSATPKMPESLSEMGGGGINIPGRNALNNKQDIMSRLFGFFHGRLPQGGGQGNLRF